MVEVSILCNGLKRYKPRAFVFPIYRWNEKLRNRGIHCEVYHSSIPENITDCNVLIVQDELTRRADLTINDLHRYSESVDTLVYYDTDDSTGNIRTNELSVVDQYYKHQLLTDRDRYLEPIYGTSVFTDFYHTEFGIEDDHHQPSVQVRSKNDLDKLRVGWNIGVIPKVFLPYNNRGWHIIETIPDTIYKSVPWDYFLSRSLFWKSANASRAVDVSGRFSTNYPHNTVEFHRERMAEVLKGRFDPEKVSLKNYWSELRNSKLLLSPFGLGEVCHRDFEGFLSGNLLFKPSMEHLETWPPMFEAGETYIDISWDMEDAEDTLDSVLEQYEKYRPIAEAGQKRYQEYLIGETAAERFVDHFEELIKSG